MVAPTVGYYPAPPPPRRFDTRRIIGVVVLVAGLLGAGMAVLAPPAAASDEVYLAPVRGQRHHHPVTIPGREPARAPGQGPAGNTPPSYPGTTPGLYGGTQGASTCNTDQIVRYLETSPEPAAVWARTLRIPPSAIRAYLTGLTEVILRTNTQVTSYGLKGERAIPSQVVLQSGTTILVEPSGLPRVRCGSGNPLEQARVRPAAGSAERPAYRGAPWPGFTPATVIVIAPTRPIGSIIIVDLGRGTVIIRVPGNLGRDAVIEVLPALLRPGDPVVVTGRQFPPGALVNIVYDVPNVLLGTATADGGGNVDTRVAIPAESGPGLHLVTAEGSGARNVLPVYILEAGA